MFDRFTERARQSVVFAQDEARSLRHNYIGTEHLLLGLLREEQGLARRALASLGVHYADAREEVVDVIGVGDTAAAGRIPFTPRAKKALELANEEARTLRRDYIATEHILLGLAREGGGVAARVLAAVTDRDDACDEIVRRLGGIPRRAPRRRRRPWLVRR